MAPTTGTTPPLVQSPTKLDRPSSHYRHSSSRSLSLLLNEAFRSSLSSSSDSACPTSPSTPTRSSGDSKSSNTNSSPTLQVIPSFSRRASDGYVHPSSMEARVSTTTSASIVKDDENGQSTSSTVQSFRTRVKRSSSTSALSALSLSSTTSPRTRQISGKAAIARPALDCTNAKLGDLTMRSRSASASALNELVIPQSCPSSSSSTESSYFTQSNTVTPHSSSMTPPKKANFASMVMTSLTPSTWQHIDEHAHEVLSPSSISSKSSCESPTTPTSPAPNTSRLPATLQRAASYSYLWCNININNKDKHVQEVKESIQNTKTYPSHYSPPPMKRSRANTVNPCSKTSAALRSITEKPREAGTSAYTATPTRQIVSGLSIRSVPSSSTIGKGEASVYPKSPRSPRSPLSQHALQAYFDPSSIPTPSPPSSCSETEDHACIIKQSSSFGTLLLPSTLSNASADLTKLSVPSTPLTTSHTIYIDHIAVSYNPSTTSGQECKKLLMKLERFRKRSSLDFGKLSSEQTTQLLYAGKNNNSFDSSVEGAKRRLSASKDEISTQMSRSTSSGSGNSTGATPNGSGNSSPHGVAGHTGNTQTFRVTAKIRENHESNKIEVVYVGGFKLIIDATGLSYIDMLERVGLHAHVMAKRNAASLEAVYHTSNN